MFKIKVIGGNCDGFYVMRFNDERVTLHPNKDISRNFDHESYGRFCKLNPDMEHELIYDAYVCEARMNYILGDLETI